jgi:hypothetical protein
MMVLVALVVGAVKLGYHWPWWLWAAAVFQFLIRWIVDSQ